MRLDHVSDGGAAARAAIGLIVLQTDETLEPELRSVFDLPGVALYHARIPMSDTVGPDSLARMAQDLPAAAALLPGHGPLAAIGYGCTSGATVIGPERIDAMLRAAHPRAGTTDPIRAVLAAVRRLGVRRLGFVTPYAAAVSAAMRALLEREGVAVAAFGSFEQPSDAAVARIAEASVLAAIEQVGTADSDAVFVSCTNLRSFGVIAAAEAAIGKPVITSNQALAWHLLSLAGLPVSGRGPGRLFQS